MDKLIRCAAVNAAIVLVAVTACIFAAAVGSVPSAYASGNEAAYALYPDTPLYSAPGGDKIATIPQNAELTLGTLSGGWYEAKYLDLEGYVRQSDVYFSAGGVAGVRVISVKVLADGVGMRVALKAAPDAMSETLEEIGDGTRIEIVECGSDAYYRVVGRGDPKYILKENVTTSLTRNQRVAMIIIGIGLASLIAALAMVYVIRNNPKYKGK